MADEVRQTIDINYKSINCENIPELFLDKLIAKKHFSKFGRIIRFILRPRRLSCTIEYETEDEAENAFMSGSPYNGHEFSISYSEREIAHVQNTEEWVDPDVKAELEAMSSKSHSYRPIKQNTLNIVPKSPKQDTPKVDTTLRNELESILRRPALSEEDKYRILDARDKLIRLTTVRTTDIKEAKSIKGTCPDMCPEKERLMREFQRQIALFETRNTNTDNGSSISHRRAIKEYSRSSADQEMPLAHELRPEPVLEMTMHYLMYNIMDLCDDPNVSPSDWFHFVWDRTRSIRKDITQQELCSLEAVELVEQCARFHIHCAARLVAVDPSVFDKKINAENLTKCLQSLKYMYHDLRIKNIPCPCEPEFRSYIILLNLGNSSFLWELKQLPEHIQNSKEIKRAVAFYNALQNNNYVRFFNMVRDPETSYLSACLLLGYFTKLRLCAMNVIVKSYKWRKNEAFLPLSYLSNILAFEDDETAENFLIYHGLECIDSRVLLDRIKEPEMEYSMMRAKKLVESKRTTSVGECVCGEKLYPIVEYQEHQPHNSFDENGMLKPDAWQADDQLRGEAAKAKQLERQQQKQTKSAQKVSLPSMNKSDANIFKPPQTTNIIGSSSSPHQQFKTPPEKTNNIFTTSVFANKSEPREVNQTKSQINKSQGFGSTKSLFQAPNNVSTLNTGSFGNIGHNFSFGQMPKVPPTATLSTGNIFSNVENKPFTKTQSIFGVVAKDSTEALQQRPALPKSIPSDSIFQHFNAANTTTDKGVKSSITTTSVNRHLLLETNNFQAQKELLQKQQKELEMNLAEERARIRELEMKEALKQEKKREEEKEKLRLVEETNRKKEALMDRNKKLESLEKNANEETERELSCFLAEEISEIANQVLSSYRSFDKTCKETLVSILNETVDKEIQGIAEEEYEFKCYEQCLVRRTFQSWLRFTQKSIRDRKLIETTPLWVTTETSAEKVAKLVHPSQYENLSLMRRYRYGQPCNFELLLKENELGGPQQNVNLHQIIGKIFFSNQQMCSGLLKTRKFFKLALSIPSENEEMPGFESICNKWLKKYVKKPTMQTEKSTAYICSMEQDIALCVRKITGTKLQTEQHTSLKNECDNIDALICFLTSVNLQTTKQRLHFLLKLIRIYKPIPVAFIIYNCSHDKQDLERILDLQKLQRANLVSSYEFFGCSTRKSEFRCDAKLSVAVKFVAQEANAYKSRTDDTLEMQSVKNWIEINLGEEMWLRWFDSTLNNPVFNKLCSSFEKVMELHNESVVRLMDLVRISDDYLPELPTELAIFVSNPTRDVPLGYEYFPKDWYNSSRQQKILQLLKKLLLPKMQDAPPCDYDEYMLWLLRYAGLCVPRNEEKAARVAHEAIKELVNELSNPDLQSLKISARFSSINYLQVVKVLAYAHIENAVQESSSAKELPEHVIYKRKDMLMYQTQPWWLNCNGIKDIKLDLTVVDKDSSMQSDSAEATINDIESIVQHAENVLAKSEKKMDTLKKQTLNASLISRELDESLYQFEFAKLIGCFDIPKIDEKESEDSENCVNTFNIKYNKCNKRKLDENASEMEEIMKKAFDIVEKIDKRIQSEKKHKFH
ncbi:protein xmas-2 [Teleopsis dalmanni]|uniref:protein xmas-2 n=1 Tax=Teleopsis dalmanni TaxID=139649 RepID=UPI0018CDC291|nr:protein xmas-2 [Teleopsis dalmanni]